MIRQGQPTRPDLHETTGESMTLWLPAFWMASGACLFAAAHFLHTRRSREHEQLYLAFGSLCLVVAAYMVGMALLQDPDNRLSIVTLERLHLAIACIIYPVAVWFMALYSRMRRWKTTVAITAGVFGLMLVADLVRPYGLLQVSMRELPPLVLPWGEEIRQFSGHTGALAIVYYACTMLVFGWAFWRCRVLWRTRDRLRARTLLIYLILQLFAVLQSEYTTLRGHRGLDWDALPFLGLVLLLSRALTREIRQYELDLGASNLALRRENAARERAQSHLEHAAYHDALTGLPNRRALREYIEAGQAHTDPGLAALIIIDPERFRVINQALGHRLGDELLREMARRLADSDHGPLQVARLDADEFAVLLSGLPADRETATRRVRAVAEAMRLDLAASIRLGTHDLSANVSAGATLFTDRQTDSDAVIREAYMALQIAKKQTRDRVAVFADPMRIDAERDLRLENDLRLDVEHGRMGMAYQLQVDAHGCPVGAEALLRWEHPEFGPIEPGEFIRIAEKRGLIDALGRIALTRACQTVATLDTGGKPFRMSVNISPWQLLLPDFPDTIRHILDDTGVMPEQLTLEITESVFVNDIDDAIAKIRTLNALGLRVAIDDFGTGFASIASLKDLPVGEMKIDRTFIKDMALDQPDRFITAMIALGRALDLNIVAEGVETEAQRQRLAAMGCNVFQGYLIGRPMTLEELKERIGKPSAR